jgi:hypothetical protein
VSDAVRAMCFSAAQSAPVGSANSTDWFIVSGAADPVCVARGKPDVARSYTPPETRAST